MPGSSGPRPEHLPGRDIADEVGGNRGESAMRMLMVAAILLSLLSPAMAATPMAAPPPSTTSASPDAGYAACLTGAVAAGAFLGAMVVQIVATGIVVPALAIATPVGAAAALATGGVLAYEAVVAAGGIGGGLAGAWVQSR